MRLLTGCFGALLAVAVTACGSATASDHGTTASTARAIAIASTTATSTGPALTPSQCAATVASTLGEVGERIYHAAASGDDVAEAVGRVRSSTALASAVAGDDASAVAAALRELLRGQIVRIEVLRGGHVLASAGAGPAVAPIRGPIPGTDASYVLSVQSDRAYLEVAHQITGAQVLMIGGAGAFSAGGPAARRLAGTIAGPEPASVPRGGSLIYGGQRYEVSSLNGATYPSGALRIALMIPSNAVSCPGSASQTRVETLGHVGERIYKEELASPSVSATLRQMESTPAFISAVAAQSVAATHAAITGFFKAHIHVVRVRVTVAGHLLIDDGGPYALAPVHGTLRKGGRVLGEFEMSIQDDAGYLKLAHLFTGAEVLMRVAGRQVKGTFNPGTGTLPQRGVLSYGGRSYAVYSFTAEAFPSGALRISLLLPSA
jgi:hypothetical protein